MKNRASLARHLAAGLEEEGALIRRYFGPGGHEAVERVRASDADRLTSDAGRRLQGVVERYGDLAAHPEREGDAGTLRECAKRALVEVSGELAVGKPAPEIEGPDADGQPFRLSDYRGKVVVLSFFGDWCSCCRATYPQERDLVRRYKGKPFALLGICTDEDERTHKRSVEAGDITWRCWRDPAGRTGPLPDRWNVAAYPTFHVLDAKGVIRYRDVHPADLKRAVDNLLAE
jgi:peroxiredoxin